MEKHYTGVTDQTESEREKLHRAIAREAAAEGIVLLRNEGVLPLQGNGKVALFGTGARHLIKGGTGSGDVNVRKLVALEEGLVNAGLQITSQSWLADYDREFAEGREEHKEKLIQYGEKYHCGISGAYFSQPAFCPASGRAITEQDVTESDTDTAIYILSRTAGEGKDRSLIQGDYYLTDMEKEHLRFLSTHYAKTIFLINTGGVIDLSILDEISIQAVLYVAQPGMEGGNAIADILTGKVVPSGKLTSTWAKRYEDYPNAMTYSHINHNVIEEKYEEGRFIGYRYFDTFGCEPAFVFGYGLSYTEFAIEQQDVTLQGNQVTVAVKVTNQGGQYAGREVVQVYVSAPQTRFVKEEKALVAFHKTKVLQPGESEVCQITFGLEQLETYDTGAASYVLEAGEYYVLVGNSSATCRAVASLVQKETVVTRKLTNICALHTALREKTPSEADQKRIEAYREDCAKQSVQKIEIPATALSLQETAYVWEESFDAQVEALVSKLSPEEMAELVCGAQDRNTVSVAGISSSSVPGAAGETTQKLQQYGIPSIVLADGPAGVRVADRYQVNPKDGSIYPVDFFDTVENGFYLTHEYEADGIDYYQYLTAIPIGTLLAQTFDEELLYRVGHLIGEECKEFEVTLWLAPGLNLHRNPLCGRNFEYYSEDPYVSGKIAAFITKGVQSVGGVGVTVKHFACNNQEDNRIGSNSVVSERTLREMYLKGFEIVVKEAHPMSLMSSYNLVNGTHSANNYDLCTKVLRCEWGFQGMVMSDWYTTNRGGGSSAAKCIAAGNDCIMPGSPNDPKEIIEALDGSNGQNLDLEALKLSSKRILRTILGSNRK